MGSALYWVSVDMHGPCYGWSMRQASAMLLVPDTDIAGVHFITQISLRIMEHWEEKGFRTKEGNINEDVNFWLIGTGTAGVQLIKRISVKR